MTYRDHVSTETLADHAEGLLGESEAGRVQTHLDDCEECRAEAMLLVSLQEILRADEVGPMPVEYASRIDVALAELAAAEPPVRLHTEAVAAVPILNAPAEAPAAAAGGAKVIDLATRRKVMMTGLRRVGTVAAGVVLLIGGAALGVQTIGKHTDLVPPPSTDAIAPAKSFETLPTPPKDAKTGKNGIKVDEKTGWIYLKSGKVLLPDGTVVLPGATKTDKPVVISPKHKTETTTPKTTAAPEHATGTDKTDKTDKSSGTTPFTAQKPRTKPATTKAPAVVPDDPADPQAPNNTSAPATPATAQPSGAKAQNQVAPSNPDDSRVGTAATKKSDTYVSQSGSEYTEDNFANKVMDLMTQASRDSATPGNYTATSSGQPQTEPTTAPTTGPSPSISPSMSPQNLAVAYYNYRRFDMQAAPPGRGPADPEVKYRVQRCATQLHSAALAGDEGIWAGHKATIVVTQAPDNANQVIGYVFYGNCNKSAPATAETAQWEQRVDKPSASPDANSSAPVKRVGGTSPGTDGSRSESYER
jgi:hypothetical protein